MYEYISKEYICNLLEKHLNDWCGPEYYTCSIILDEIKDAPTEKIARGHWNIDKSFMPFVCACSECRAIYDVDGAFEWRHCPICGTKMEEE